ncbi:MAG: hypothetical protein FVQ78_10920, partial [Solirubrobacterales bacterium]|nr:hypothetical protein [Solirubrobacterales bacterium]
MAGKDFALRATPATAAVIERLRGTARRSYAAFECELRKQGCKVAVYRVPLIPVTPLDPYMQATLWPRNAEAVISHASALGLYELGDVNPAKINITVPRAHRPRREVPALYVLHREDLGPEDLTTY